MGGGAGVSLHGRFRVATDNTVYTRNQNQVTFFLRCHFYLSIQYNQYLGSTKSSCVMMQLEICLFKVLLNIKFQA